MKINTLKKLFISFSLFIGYFSFGQIKPMVYEKLNNQLFVYQSFNTFQGKDYNANALYLVTDEGVVLFDVPWQKSQYETLINYIETKHHLPVVAVFVTHSHEDRAGDLSYFNDLDIPTFASEQTNIILEKEGKATAENVIDFGKEYRYGKEKFVINFLGEGHTKDNVVVWFPKYKILDGGCLVKSEIAQDLGYIGEANLEQWPIAIEEIQKTYPKIKQVIPGHDAWRGKRHLENTLELLKNRQN